MSNVEGEAVSRWAHLPRACKSLGGSSPLHPPCMRPEIGQTGNLSQSRVRECAGNDNLRRETHLSRTVSKNSQPEENLIQVDVHGVFAFSGVFEGFRVIRCFCSRGFDAFSGVFARRVFAAFSGVFAKRPSGVIQCFSRAGKVRRGRGRSRLRVSARARCQNEVGASRRVSS